MVWLLLSTLILFLNATLVSILVSFLFMAGLSLIFYRFFGRILVLSPPFIIGALFVGLGSLVLIVGYENSQKCSTFCLAYNPDYGALIMIVGLLFISGYAYRWRKAGFPVNSFES